MAKTPVMQRLKSDTAELHDDAERQEFQRRMLRAELSRDDYARWLGQMLLIHRALERPLARLREEASLAPLLAAVHPEQMSEPHLLSDLEVLGVDPDGVEPLAATRELVALLESTAEQDPLALLGHHYVLEGSTNGNRFIARQLGPALGLVAGRGDRYLDPYGAEQPRKWAQFKEEMGEIDFSEDQIDRLAAAAGAMFRGISALSHELQALADRGGSSPDPRIARATP